MSNINKILIITEGLDKAFMEAFVDNRLSLHKENYDSGRFSSFGVLGASQTKDQSTTRWICVS
jgi:hypothetical protein